MVKKQHKPIRRRPQVVCAHYGRSGRVIDQKTPNGIFLFYDTNHILTGSHTGK